MESYLQKIREAGDRFGRDVMDAKWELEQIIDHARLIICVKDKDNNIVRVNKYLADMLGTTPGEWGIRSCWDLFNEREAKIFHQNDLEVINTGKPLLGKPEPFTDKTGKTFYALSDKYPLHKNGGIAGVLVFAFDKTEDVEFKQHLVNCEVLCKKHRAEVEKYLRGFSIDTGKTEQRME